MSEMTSSEKAGGVFHATAHLPDDEQSVTLISFSTLFPSFAVGVPLIIIIIIIICPNTNNNN
jgi:hypothetical protein